MNRREKRIIVKYEWWIVGLLSGKIPNNNYARRSFLKFHHNSAPPQTELQRTWVKFRRIYKNQQLGDVFYKRARSLHIASNQNTSISDHEVIRAFQLAKTAGSSAANQWLLESKAPTFTSNSIWTRSILSTYDVNGRNG